MMDYFNNQIKVAGLAQAEGEPIIACQVNLDKNYAFLEVNDRLPVSILIFSQSSDEIRFLKFVQGQFV